MNDLFHIHTYRCKHAEIIPNEEFIEKVISLGYSTIWFSDHNPFPDDKFTNRMNCNELDDYISELQVLKRNYSDIIDIEIGLETDFLPDYKDYYHELHEKCDFLLLGQHIFKYKGMYNFDLDTKLRNKIEYEYLYDLIIQALDTNLFQFVAHPDRIFRNKAVWDNKMQEMSVSLMNAARHSDVKLEINLCSMRQRNYFWPQFWESVPVDMTVIGHDAHKLNDIIECPL